MSASATPLKGLNRYITFPSTVSGVLGSVLGVLYALITIDFPQGTFGVLLGCVAVFVVLANVFGDRTEQNALKTVKRVGTGELPLTRENLAAAISEAHRFPDTAFWIAIAFWVGGSAAIGFTYGVLPEVKLEVALRIAGIGISLGPLVSVLTYLMSAQRVREVINRIAAQGLSRAQVIAALPPKRFQLQRRLVIYSVVAVATPLWLIADMAWRYTERVFSSLARAGSSKAQLEVLSTTGNSGWWAVVGVAVLVVAVVLVCGWISGSSLGLPMRLLASATHKLADGKLGSTSLVPAEDEVWAVSAGFVQLEEQLVDAVAQLKTAGVQIGSATQELVSSSNQHEQGAREQTAALAQTSATTEELARSARQIAAHANQVAELASRTVHAARNGKDNADQFYSQILKVREGNQTIADSVVRLNKRVQQIGRIVDFIDGIADKSDLLALNAELEGNKAGEVGRGFSLVAAEMRRLAESVMSSTREITRLIEEVRDATNAAVMATEAGVKASDSGSALAQQVSESLKRILIVADRTSDAVKSISLATHQQEVGTEQLAQAMSDILRATQAGSKASNQMSQANTDLQALSGELQKSVDRFEIVTVAPAPAPAQPEAKA